MFDFEKLNVYKKSKLFNQRISRIIESYKLDTVSKNQLRRASISITLNIAEGSGRFTKPDRRNFYIISRSSLFECIAILDILKDSKVISHNTFNEVYLLGEVISKMLFSMISNYDK